jgi:hypothetical protein
MEASATTGQASEPPFKAAEPMPLESMGLYMETEGRRGPNEAPYSCFCTVNLHQMSNVSKSFWFFPRLTFYGEQNGEYFALRTLETNLGGLGRPWTMTNNLITLPRPPRAGMWKIFCVQDFSDAEYQGWKTRQSSEELKRIDASGYKLWKKRLVSNAIVIQFTAIGPEDQNNADSFIQSLIAADNSRRNSKRDKEKSGRNIRQ